MACACEQTQPNSPSPAPKRWHRPTPPPEPPPQPPPDPSPATPPIAAQATVSSSGQLRSQKTSQPNITHSPLRSHILASSSEQDSPHGTGWHPEPPEASPSPQYPSAQRQLKPFAPQLSHEASRWQPLASSSEQARSSLGDVP
eukprot:1622821-Rhodomonas_salina.1